MNYIEYGKENDDVIILLHGGGLSWWNYREVAEKLSSDYHIILPILDGHANSSSDFVSIEDNAAKIIDFIDKQFGGSVLMIGGLSLGAQVALEILSQKKDICKFALIESALVVPSKFTYAMIKPVFGSCYGLIKHKWFSKLQFKSLRIKPNLFEDYFRDTCGISKSNMIAFLEANALYGIKPSIVNCSAKSYIFVGEKENRAMQKSAKIIHEKLQGSLLKILPKMYHGEFSINYSDDYVNQILNIVSER
ncbi:MAG: alpha/beta hydrolase [Oscillospiraceae bacterium]|nr:alpha/beta hydrolase [Oscillospiraceae bacterium]